MSLTLSLKPKGVCDFSEAETTFLSSSGGGRDPFHCRYEGRRAVDVLLGPLLPLAPAYPPKLRVRLIFALYSTIGSQRKDGSKSTDSVLPPRGSGENFGDSQIVFFFFLELFFF